MGILILYLALIGMSFISFGIIGIALTLIITSVFGYIAGIVCSVVLVYLRMITL